MNKLRFNTYFFLMLASVLSIGLNGCIPEEDPNPTLDSKMTLTLLEVTDVNVHTAICQSEITSEELNSGYLDRGVCWSKSPFPTLDDAYVEETNSWGFGTFTNALSGLLPSTVYHIRAYISQGAETVYSNMISIKTRGVDPPCSPDTNTLVQGPEDFSFYYTYGEPEGSSSYEMRASGTGVQIRISFKEIPTSGKYVTKWRDNFNPGKECVVYGSFRGWSVNYSGHAAEEDTLYIFQNGENKYDVSFCDLKFEGGITTGNITVE